MGHAYESLGAYVATLGFVVYLSSVFTDISARFAAFKAYVSGEFEALKMLLSALKEEYSGESLNEKIAALKAECTLENLMKALVAVKNFALVCFYKAKFLYQNTSKEDIMNAFVDAKTSTLAFYENIMASPVTIMILTGLMSFYAKAFDIYRVIIAGYPMWKKQAIEFADAVPGHVENLKQTLNNFAAEMVTIYKIVGGKVVIAKDNLEVAKDSACVVGASLKENMGECLEKSQQMFMGVYESVRATTDKSSADKFDFGAEPASE